MPDAFPGAVDVAALLAKLGVVPRRVTADSRLVGKSDAFAAFPGERTDGRAYIADAIARGAAAVLFELADFRWSPAWQVTHLGVQGLKAKLGAIADVVYGRPSQALWMIGVTGTNGKTSCTQWIAQCLDACGRRCAVMGTLGNGVIGRLVPAQHTTPDAARVHELLAQFRAAGANAVAMEVSSHGLDQGRANGVAFDVALFTNLTRDHLDYHGTMAAYGAAKEKLLAWPTLRTSVINSDDMFGLRLIESARANGRSVLTYGFGSADIAATAMSTNATGIALSVATPWGKGDVQTRLLGAFNASNLLGVLGVLLASDVAFETALHALARVTAPAGRMELLGGPGEPRVAVDYAHSPDALAKALQALRPAVASGHELICVFGCGGDRDKGKRPEMGAIAGELADRVVVTTDNPRSEDPAEIASAIVHGVRSTANRRWSVELDRGVAIRTAIGEARPGDVVLIAGKGHETYQERNGKREHFSDAAVARSALSARSGA